MDLKITFLGTGGSFPNAQRAPTSVLVTRGADEILIDCGEGTQRQLLRSIGLPEIDAIFLTHFHADHTLGLVGILKTFSLQRRSKTLNLYGPQGVRSYMSHLQYLYGKKPTYKLVIHELETGKAVKFGTKRDEYEMRAFAVNHGTNALGYALVESPRPGVFDQVKAKSLGVEPGPLYGQLQHGNDVKVDGKLVRSSTVVGKSRPGRTIVFSGDTRPIKGTVDAARNADLLIHEASFTDAEQERAKFTKHSTAAEAGSIAAQAKTQALVLTHLSSRYPVPELKKQAHTKYSGKILVPSDLDTISVPYAERGKAHLEKNKSR